MRPAARAGIVFLVVVLSLFFENGAGSWAAPPPPPVEPSDTFATPSGATPSPIKSRPEVTSCKGEDCNGTDPKTTGCALPENGAYDQDVVEVHDQQGVLLGSLVLRANHEGCDSTQWAQFRNLTQPLTFRLRVVQNRTGISTETVRMEDWREDTWTMQLHSPIERVRAEVVVYDQNGRVIASEVTDSY